MQGKKDFTPKMMYQLHLDEMVPKDNFYRKVDAALDLNFLYKKTKKYYGTEGQESIDPVVFFKMCLVGYFNNINSDRKLIEYCSNCLDIRLFLRYDIDEVLPWHSTISRTRQLFGEEVFQSCFKEILSLCVHEGMVRGKRQVVDSVFVKANASMDSLLEKEITEDVENYCDELNEGSEYKVSIKKSAEVKDKNDNKIKTNNANTEPSLKIEITEDVENCGDQLNEGSEYKVNLQIESEGKDNIESKDETGEACPKPIVEEQDTDEGEQEDRIRPKNISNETHYSTTDGDSRISTKPGKPRQLNYLGQIAVDDAHHVITAALADFADKRDAQCLPGILSQSKENLAENDITIDQVAADTNYSSGEALLFCEANNIEAYIPNIGQYQPNRKGFEYDEANDRYLCTRGNKAILPYKGLVKNKGSNNTKMYSSSTKDCKDCPFLKKCIIGKGTSKKIYHSIHKPLYDKMHDKMQTTYAKRIMRIRGKTVEPVLGTLVNFRGMKRVNARGIEQANKHVIMASAAYNLKKYLNFISRKSVANVDKMFKKAQPMVEVAQSIAKEAINSLKNAFSGFITSFLMTPDFKEKFLGLRISLCYKQANKVSWMF
jgi:transposase